MIPRASMSAEIHGRIDAGSSSKTSTIFSTPPSMALSTWSATPSPWKAPLCASAEPIRSSE
jgi:hypothetical protein